MKIVEFNNKDIKSLEEFEQECLEVFTSYLIQLSNSEEMIEDTLSNNFDDKPIDFLWTEKAIQLIEDKIKELKFLSKAYYGDDVNFNIESTMYKRI